MESGEFRTLDELVAFVVERGGCTEADVRLFVGVSNDLSRSCHCFVDTTNGDILKPDSYKKPAPRARGNIYDAPAVIDPRVLPHY